MVQRFEFELNTLCVEQILHAEADPVPEEARHPIRKSARTKDARSDRSGARETGGPDRAGLRDSVFLLAAI